ncbi:glycosyltransferase family 4 protein [Bradyrhizobium canariense]|uniref:Glycosyltransferase involved in cell wall bisynthesis n=1 Tax=Bradyrhizobium canariense TaxID=255045 RepID=A0A1H2BNP8_9BRAD|nr:glycosyltransferase family 4 protein [Bradyrhizobium canariense]SDT59682.1 Glycosyltransferase involved in cell wall bisynthesis [Bradyrhizobium canariense]
MRITCLVKRWDHHTDSGGYDRLASAVGAKVIKQKRLTGNKSRVVKKLWSSVANTDAYLLDYRLEDRLAEQRLLAGSMVNPPDVVHVLYGDEQLDFLLRWRSLLRCPLVATFHLPAERTAPRFEHFQAKEIKGIDAAIVLARSEIASFERWFGADKVVYVPHGIDTARFRPGERQSRHDELRVLIVGEHMRDWEVAHRVIDEARHHDLDIQFDVVTRPDVFPYFTGCSNLTLHSHIPEARLIELYQEADLLFLPLKGSTANNSLLEGLACGTPAIVSDIGGIPDYMSNDSGWLIPEGDAVSAFELIKQLCADRDLARSRRDGARHQALKFDWRQVAERLSIVYSAVKAGRSPAAAMKEFEQNIVVPAK